METCPHGARIVLELGKPPRLVDECEACAVVLEEHPCVITERELARTA